MIFLVFLFQFKVLALILTCVFIYVQLDWEDHAPAASHGISGGERSLARLGNDNKPFKLIYIKTLKTGSSTITNILYRFALRHNLNVMTFYQESPRPIHKMGFLRKEPQPTFHMIMEHLLFNETFFDKVMPGHKHYISSLRYPLHQLISHIHYKNEMVFAHQSKRKRSAARFDVSTIMSSSKEIDKLGQRYIKIPKEHLGSSDDMMKYLQELNSKFLLMLITEYYDASLIMLKRKLSIELKDLIYSPLKRGIYATENSAKLLSQHKKMKPEEYALFLYFNNTLWNSISKESSDFWSEVEHFESVNHRVSRFCEQYHKRLQTNTSNIYSIINDPNGIRIKSTSWNEEFVIDPLDCIMMKVHKTVFLLLNTIKNFPVLCSKKSKVSRDIDIRRILLDDSKRFKFNSKYCSEQFTRYNIPLEVFTMKGAYDWDDYFRKQK